MKFLVSPPFGPGGISFPRLSQKDLCKFRVPRQGGERGCPGFHKLTELITTTRLVILVFKKASCGGCGLCIFAAGEEGWSRHDASCGKKQLVFPRSCGSGGLYPFAKSE